MKVGEFVLSGKIHSICQVKLRASTSYAISGGNSGGGDGGAGAPCNPDSKPTETGICDLSTICSSLGPTASFLPSAGCDAGLGCCVRPF